MKSNALCLVGLCSGWLCGLSGHQIPLQYVFGLCSDLLRALIHGGLSLHKFLWSLQWFIHDFIRRATTTAICFWSCSDFSSYLSFGGISLQYAFGLCSDLRAGLIMGDISLHVCFWSLQWLIEWFNSSMTTTAICFWSLQWFSFEFICMIVTTALFFFGLCSGLPVCLTVR